MKDDSKQPSDESEKRNSGQATQRIMIKKKPKLIIIIAIVKKKKEEIVSSNLIPQSDGSSVNNIYETTSRKITTKVSYPGIQQMKKTEKGKMLQRITNGNRKFPFT